MRPAVYREVVSFDLPCYPDVQPTENRRVACSVVYGFCGQKHYSVQIGGSGYATAATKREALALLPKYVTLYLRRHLRDAETRAEYYRDQLDGLSAHLARAGLKAAKKVRA